MSRHSSDAERAPRRYRARREGKHCSQQDHQVSGLGLEVGKEGLGVASSLGSMDGLGQADEIVRKGFHVFSGVWVVYSWVRKEAPGPEDWVEWREKFIPEEELALENF